MKMIESPHRMDGFSSCWKKIPGDRISKYTDRLQVLKIRFAFISFLFAKKDFFFKKVGRIGSICFFYLTMK